MADVVATPNPAPANSTVYLTGCGYDQDPVTIKISSSVYNAEYGAGVFTAGGGCLQGPGESGVSIEVKDAAEYLIAVYQAHEHGKNKPPDLKASTTLVVS